MGGRIDPGENLINNLKREVLEETGINLNIEPKLIYAQDIIIPDVKKHVVRLTYLGEIKNIKIKLSDEHDDFKWFSSDELKKLDSLDKYFK